MKKKWSDKDYMAMAIALSMRARGNSGPNPNVGCVIVKNGRIVGRGWTQPSGRPHAEAMAIEMAKEKAIGADIYITLEPCNHESMRGPDCASVIIAAQPARVICALTDPDPRTNGNGLQKIANAGIHTVNTVMAAQARRAMAGFFTRLEYGRPFVTLKLALSLDGCIALHNGVSQWITGNTARNHGHLERAFHDAILVGSGTIRPDTPRLDVRLEGLEGRSPQRYLLGSSSPPKGWEMIANPADITSIAHNYLMIEGGAAAAASFLTEDLVDRLLIYRAPILMGGKAAIADLGLEDLSAAHGKWMRQKQIPLGKDILEIYERPIQTNNA